MTARTSRLNVGDYVLSAKEYRANRAALAKAVKLLVRIRDYDDKVGDALTAGLRDDLRRFLRGRA